MVVVIKQGSSKEAIQKLWDRMRGGRKGLDAHKFCGVLQLEEDPLTIQKEMRNEWE